jgi:hypothetical protein
MRFVTQLFVSSSPDLNAPAPQNQESFLAIAETKLMDAVGLLRGEQCNVAVAVVTLSPGVLQLHGAAAPACHLSWRGAA